MPLIARLHVKCAFAWLLIAAGLHVLQASIPLIPALSPLASFGPAILHLYLLGWLSQLIFGISYWMFPRYSRERPHFSEPLAAACVLLINTGLLLRLITEPLVARQAALGFSNALLVVSGVVQWLGILAYVVNTWPRVRRRPDAR